MKRIDESLRELSGGWLGRFFAAMRTDARRTAASAYLVGLLDPDPRKSLRAIAERTNRVAYHQLHHFSQSKSGRDELVWNEILNYSNEYSWRCEGCLVVRDFVIPKRGNKSAGVAVQSYGPDEKRLNCQAVVSFAMVRGGHVMPVAMRLVDSNENDSGSGCNIAIESNYRTPNFSSPSEIIVEEIKRLRRSGARIDVAVLELRHCSVPRFLEIFKDLKIRWAIRVPGAMEFWIHEPSDGKAVLPRQKREEKVCGSSLAGQSMKWSSPHQHFAASTKWPLRAGRTNIRIPEEVIWKSSVVSHQAVQLVAEIHRGGNNEYYISNMHVAREIHSIVAVMQSYWFCKDAYAKMTETFGLTKFEGRSKIGLYRHLLLVSIAYIYSKHADLDEYKRKHKF